MRNGNEWQYSHKNSKQLYSKTRLADLFIQSQKFGFKEMQLIVIYIYLNGKTT